MGETCHRRAGLVRALSGLLLTLVLSGCQSSIYSLSRDNLYSPAEYRYAAGDKRLHTVLLGNPSNTSDADFERRVIALMHQTNHGFDTPLVRPATFTTGPGDRPEYLVVVAFNAGSGTSAADLCADPAAASGGGAALDRIETRMVFCREKHVLSTSHAVLDPGSGPDDPRFAWMIRSLTRELFPHREHRDGRGRSLLLD